MFRRIVLFLAFGGGFGVGFLGFGFLGIDIFGKEPLNIEKTKKSLAQKKEPTIILAPTTSLTPTLIPTLKPTEALSPTLEILPTATLAQTPILEEKNGTGVSSEQINSLLDQYATLYGVDVNVLRHLAICESGMDPTAETEYYAGLYQFSEYTWRHYRELLGEDIKPELRFNAEEAVKTAAYAISVGGEHNWPNCYPE